jgi:hypothetical protein
MDIRVSHLGKRLQFLVLYHRDLASSRQESSFTMLLASMGIGGVCDDKKVLGQEILDALQTIFVQAHYLFKIRPYGEHGSYVLIHSNTFALCLNAIEAICADSRQALALQEAFMRRIEADNDEFALEAKRHMSLPPYDLFEIYKVKL